LLDPPLLLLHQLGQRTVVVGGRDHRPGWIKFLGVCRSLQAPNAQAVAC
jgi:hypothetical protein